MRYVFLLLLLASTQESAFAASPTPDTAAREFYRWVIAHNDGGLPSEAQRKELPRIVTPELVNLLAAASETERKCIANLPPDIKGPVWEGNLFVNNYEGATKVRYGRKIADGRDVVIETHLLYAEPRRPKGENSPPYAWQDRVRLHKTEEGWLVADVERGKTLTAMLRNYVRQAC